MNKKLILGVALAVLLAGVGVIIGSDSISFRDVMGSLSGMNPKLMGLIALPFIVVLLIVGNYLLKKNEERKWKKALMKTRADKQKQDMARQAAKDKQPS